MHPLDSGVLTNAEGGGSSNSPPAHSDAAGSLLIYVLFCFIINQDVKSCAGGVSYVISSSLQQGSSARVNVKDVGQ